MSRRTAIGSVHGEILPHECSFGNHVQDPRTLVTEQFAHLSLAGVTCSFVILTAFAVPEKTARVGERFFDGAVEGYPSYEAT